MVLGSAPARAQWLLGVCLAASGMFGGAAAQLQPLLDLPAGADADHVHYAAMAAGTLSSIHRQVGRFAEARNYDEWAQEVAPNDPFVAFDSAPDSAPTPSVRWSRSLPSIN